MAQSRKLSKLTYKQVTRPRVRFNPGSKRHLQAREHEEKTLELRKKGWSYNEIGAQLGISRVAAYQCVMRVLAAYESDIKENVPAVRRLELERCDAMTKALAKRVAKGDVRAILADLRVMDHRAKLTGIYAPTRLEHTGADGDPIEMKLSDAELATEIRQLASVLGWVLVAAPAAEPEPIGKTDPQKIESGLIFNQLTALR
jgi:hypothetical protein